MELWRQLAEASFDGVFAFERDQRITLWNRAMERLTGWSVGEHLFPEYIPEVLAGREVVFEPRPYEILATAKRGLVEGRLFPVRDGSGQVTGGVGIVRDVSERMARAESEQRMREAIRIRDIFLSVASHELRTPLTPMKMQTQMMLRNVAKGDPLALSRERIIRLLEQNDRSLTQLVRLIDDMLDVSRIQTGRLVLRPQGIRLSELMMGVIQRYAPQLALAGIAVTHECVADTEGQWDRHRLEQVFTNLITNAIRYAPGKPLAIEVSRAGARARVVVRDYGPGIALEDQSRIFQRFERVDSTNHVSGLGLGLYIAREMVHAHGGSIRVESTPGNGAKFTVELPI